MARTEPHLIRFVEQAGRLAEGEGLPRIAGRMMALLMVSGRHMGIDELSQALRVSRASVSTNGQLLRQLNIAERVTVPGDRRDYLQISGDPCSALLNLGLRRLRTMRDAIREMRHALRAGGAGVRARLNQTERCYDAAVERVESLLGSWQRGRGRD